MLVVPKLVNKKGNSQSTPIIGIKSNSISQSDIDGYNLINKTIWISNPLGITYNLPEEFSTSVFKGSASFTYMHGSSFTYDYSVGTVYVDKSLENHNNLETLASDIIGKKLSEKYRGVYGFGSNELREFKNQKTEKIKIGKINTVYFESDDLKSNFDTKQIEQ